MPHNPNFAHVAVRFPARMLECIETEKTATAARSIAAVVRAELEAQLDPSREDFSPYHRQSPAAPRTSMWLPRPLFHELHYVTQTFAAEAKITPSDLVVTLLTPRFGVPYSAPARAVGGLGQGVTLTIRARAGSLPQSA